MNPFFFVRYQSQKASPPLTSNDDASRNALARKALVRQDLESRNQGLYSWNQDVEFATSVEMGLGKLGRFIKTEWPLVLAALLLLTGLSLVSFQIFIVLICLIAIALMLVIGQQADQYRGLMTETYSINRSVKNDLEENQPRFIPLTQCKSIQGRVEKPRREPPRQYRLNTASTDSRPQVS